MDNPNVQPRARQKHRSLAEDLVTELSRRIREGELARAAKLPTESQVMQEHGVSRTVVREAISRLQASGLVETRHGIGTFVRDIPSASGFYIDPDSIVTLHDVLAVLELRISLEVEAAGLACSRRTDQQLQLMRDSLDALNSPAVSVDYAVSADFQFHQQIALATGNRYFTDIMLHLGLSIIPRTRLHSTRHTSDAGPYLERLSREHEDIYKAIARRDSDAARAAMRLHLSNSRERMRKAYESSLKG
ncbi:MULTISPECIES: FadR/GntR family transcriptional regulator [Pseudomonas]|jgi:GntR family transcriptional repressor for pyruvate dehydrogenase complex|uniref:FadR family transcriptional regulator n=1 Tax=Pseudomonas psychrophila TaxID=122355 RepID=A0A8I1FMZ6_9PSED|nr:MULTISPECIES: FadR/GntR family transcriptional regulator [Pseudomonas]EPJ91055.1 putative GntR family regulatory protein [Pseudomonas psychrophila]KAB0491594.1 FadR family transcriptional regulator [Pseudomonas psychrophila]KMN00705.1 GntR family transcriptional regulator [Pseudomonas psychrophila]KOX66260.1 GntR family transcriptional regulator [Pseudomonas psychrophila]MBJ2257406.1 FadR family transcriptional regulator [Pseudomonas psychrophila]